MSPLSTTDAALLRRSTRRLAVQTAAIVAVVVVALLALVVAVGLRQQRQVTDTLLERAVASADDVADPPAGTWLAIREDGAWRSSPGMPPGFPRLPGEPGAESETVTPEKQVGAGGVFVDVEVGETSYRTFTQPRHGRLVQAVTDVSRQREEQAHALLALLAVGVVGLLVSAAVGRLLARRAVAPLVSALALQREFVADASHELRAPLTVLSTRVQLLARSLRSAEVPERLRSEAAAVSRDTGRLVETVEDLLLSAEPRDPSTWQRLDLAALATEVVDAVRGHAQTGGVEVTVEPSPAGTSTAVLGTPVALRRALLAVIDNAVTHTPAGGHVTVTISGPRGRAAGAGGGGRDRGSDGSVVRVDVADTGPGIAPEDVEAVFRRFHSGTERAGRRSYGLGLSLALAVAHRHDGELSVLQTGPQGTTFRLSLPAA